MTQSEQTKRALAILQQAIDRDDARKRLRYGRGHEQKPTTHDELQDSMDRVHNLLNSKETK